MTTAGLLEEGIRRAIWVLRQHPKIEGSRLAALLLEDVIRQAGLEPVETEGLAG